MVRSRASDVETYVAKFLLVAGMRFRGEIGVSGHESAKQSQTAPPWKAVPGEFAAERSSWRADVEGWVAICLGKSSGEMPSLMMESVGQRARHV
jgi:hypothetical protein